MTTEADALVLRYLQDLESQLGDLPANRRQELLDEVGEHIAAARADSTPRPRPRPGSAPCWSAWASPPTSPPRPATASASSPSPPGPPPRGWR
jgi:HAAS